MKRLLVFILLIFSTALIFSFDFGLLHNQRIETGNNEFLYTPDFTPWFSWNNKQGVSLYFSALLSLKNDNGENPAFIPELSRFAFIYRFGNGMSVEAGRIVYSDILGINAMGLFDGARFESGNLSAAVLYTGLLYKETAKVIVSADDADNYVEPWSYDNFDKYFASRRAIANVRYTYPLKEGGRLIGELLCQFDLNNNTEDFHSQYGSLLLDLFPTDKFRITAGAIFETIQRTDTGFGIAFGGLAQMQTALPTPINDSLGVAVKYTTGPGKDVSAFTPISSVSQGAIFPGTIGGLALVSLNYEARLLPVLFAECALRYFMQTYDDDMPDASPGNLYGAEIWASVTWLPFDDVRFNLSAGAFFPGLGNMDIYGTDVMWKISAGLSVSF